MSHAPRLAPLKPGSNKPIWRTGRLRKLFTTVIGIVVLAFVAVVLAFSLVFVRIWVEERDASQREVNSVARVFESHKEQLLSGIERYAASNAAYQNIDKAYSESWIERRFSTEMADITGYSAAFLIDPELNVIYENIALSSPERLTDELSSKLHWDLIEEIHSNYLRLLPELPSDGTQLSKYFDELSGVQVVKIGDELALTAAFAIVPDPGNISLSHRSSFILVTLHLLDRNHLDGILANLSLTNLEHAKSIPSGMNGLLLHEDSATEKSYLVWTPMSKGTSILISSAPFLIAAIVAIFFVALKFIRQNARAQSKLEEGDAQLKSALLIAKMSGFTLSTDNKFIWRDEILHILGLESFDGIGSVDEFCTNMVHIDDLKEFKYTISKCWEDREPFACEFRVTLGSGTTLKLRMQAQVLFRENEDRASVVGIVQDITEFKLLADKLRQSQKMEAIGNLTGGIAHDFNNLLAVILGNIESVQDGADSETQEKLLERAVDAIERAANLTRKMLTFARQAPLEPERLDINQVVKNTNNWATRVFPVTIDLETSLLAGLWPVKIDHISAENTLLNLLLNARDAMPDGGKLSVETSNVHVDYEYLHSHSEDLEIGRYVLLTVTDTGTGIAPEKIDMIFEPFYTSKKVGEGTGLGLSAVQGFMKQSGGIVQVHSELGFGTTFKLFFPAIDAAEQDLSKAPGQIHSGKNFQATILVVEDDKEILKLLVTSLNNAGYTVIPALSGDQALEKYNEAEKIDLLLTDIVMPGNILGPKLAQLLRQKQPSLPIILMSGYATEASVHAKDLRPEDIRITKPVKRAELITSIEKALCNSVERPASDSADSC